jgi:hypothetical protein
MRNTTLRLTTEKQSIRLLDDMSRLINIRKNDKNFRTLSKNTLNGYCLKITFETDSQSLFVRL